MKIIKEFESQATGVKCILRFNKYTPFNEQGASGLFNEAAKDFPVIDRKDFTFNQGQVEVTAQSAPKGYKAVKLAAAV